MMDKEDRLAEIAGNPDETQIVSLKDLEELEYLQLTGSDKTVSKSRRAVPLGMLLGLLAALCLAAALAAIFIHHGTPPATTQTMPQGGR